MELSREEFEMLKHAYEVGGRSPGRESEENLAYFEQKYEKIPTDYRWLLKEFGGCHLLDPEINPLVLLTEDFKEFNEFYANDEAMKISTEDFFPCGSLNGEMVGILEATGQVAILPHDMYVKTVADLEVISNSFKELVMNLAQNRLEIEELINNGT